jgi:diaminopimelate epimerase
MGQPRFEWQSIPLAYAMDTLAMPVGWEDLQNPAAVNVGNPHVVFFVDDLDDVDVAGLAPTIQADPLFPEQVNVGVAELIAPDRMRLTVYERGAGLTGACGSGACVAHFAALSRGLTDQRRMTVEQPGGALDIEILADGSAVMTGPVAFSFSGVLPATSG